MRTIMILVTGAALAAAAAGCAKIERPKKTAKNAAPMFQKLPERQPSFLDRKAMEPGAKSFPSGLVYKTLRPGSGPKPGSPTAKVNVHYKGTLTDGTVFDSSYKRGQPITFPLNRVIPCWTQGVQMMRVGEKAELVCPSRIAYGRRGHPPVIPPDATLVFEVELLGIAP